MAAGAMASNGHGRDGHAKTMRKLLLIKHASPLVDPTKSSELWRLSDKGKESCAAVVTHGTVLALFVARHSKENPFQLWRRMGLPSFVVMSLPEYRLEQMVERVG